jgi:hypothetical protein
MRMSDGTRGGGKCVSCCGGVVSWRAEHAWVCVRCEVLEQRSLLLFGRSSNYSRCCPWKDGDRQARVEEPEDGRSIAIHGQTDTAAKRLEYSVPATGIIPRVACGIFFVFPLAARGPPQEGGHTGAAHRIPPSSSLIGR